MSNQLIKSNALKDVVQRDEVKNRLKEIMGQRAPQFAAALVQIVNQSWQLQKCEPNSVIGAALAAASLDLSIDPNIGEAHIVPYGDKATFQIGYLGFGQLAMRSSQYKNLGWVVVHENELLHYDELSGELEINSNNPGGQVVGYAAKFKLLNGFERGVYWTKEAVLAHAERFSKAYGYAKSHPEKQKDCAWFHSFDRMALKTVLKFLLKVWGPKSVQMQKAIKMDEGAVIDADTGEVAYVDSTTPTEPSKPDFGDKSVDAEVIPAKAAMGEPVPKNKPSEPSGFNVLKAVRGLIKSAKMEEEDFVKYLVALGSVDETVTKLDEVDAGTLALLSEDFQNIATQIKEQK
jgi:recombination protein RecT